MANVVSRAIASSNSVAARTMSAASLARTPCEYFRSASSERVVTCSSGSLERIVFSDSPMRSRSLWERRSTAAMIAPSSCAVSRSATSAEPSAADSSSADTTYPRPSGSICPCTTALAPSRCASSRASAGSSGVPGARPMRTSAWPTAAPSSNRITPDCARSTRKASVSDGPSVESLVRFSKSASTSRSR